MTKKEILKWFKFYKNNGWSLVPIVRNDKRPLELAWTSKEHKDPREWVTWYADGINFGVRTGEVSNLTIIDIDQKEIPAEIKELLNDTLSAKTNKGFHFFYQYESDLPKTNLRRNGLNIDIENDGGQCVIFPSKLNNIPRLFYKNLSVNKMSKELKKYILDLINSTPEKKSEFSANEITYEGQTPTLPEGTRNSFLTSLGGALRKQLNINQTRYVINLLNKRVCEDPLSQQEISAMLGSLEQYQHAEEIELGKRILDQLRIAEEMTERDIREVVKEEKELILKALRYLLDNSLIFKRRSMYHISKHAEWKEEFIDDGCVLPYKVPYWHEHAVFRSGDLAILGAGSGFGKSTLSVNILKGFIKQGIKPYYITLESGNRFASISKSLGLKEGDFYWCNHQNPESIELEKNAVTILDWLLPKDYATVDKLFAHFNEQLERNGGLLIVMMQLRKDGSFFAENLVEFFPSFVCKYGFEDEYDRSYSFFETIKIRESKQKMQRIKIPCKYDFDTKEVVLVQQEDELDEQS